MSSDAAFFDHVSDSDRFRATIRRFDELNAADPNVETVNGETHPRELLNAQRLSTWVMRLEPNASEVLRLASRCQHMCRWIIPRNLYAMSRAGYHQWRNDLKRFHAEKSEAVLRETGYDDDAISRVRALNLKKNFPTDPESRVLEDALCLVFLEFQFAELAAKTDADKVVNALQKSWKKMTPAGQEHALKLSYSPHEMALLQKALNG